MKIKKCFFALAAAASLLCTSNAMADGVVDGSIGGLYGSAIELQTVQTGFGNNLSELNGGYAYCADGRLYLGLTGNLEENFNKLEIFFDVDQGVGENTLSSAPDYDFNGGGGWNSSNLGGMTFDNGFTAQYHMFVRSGGGGNFEVDFIDRLGGGSASVNGNTGDIIGDGGIVSTTNLANNAVASALAYDLFFAFDNSNGAGVGGDGSSAADPTAAAAVTTGFEMSIALSDLGLDSSVANTIRIAAMIGNGDHNFLSNQVLGGLPAPQGNLGGDGSGGFTGSLSGVDFNNFSGNQFMTVNLPAHVIPEPGSVAVLLACGSLIACRRRR